MSALDPEPDCVNVGAGYRHTELPAEQKAGTTQVVTFETLQVALVYWMVRPEQEYAGVHTTVRTAPSPTPTPPLNRAVPPGPVHEPV